MRTTRRGVLAGVGAGAVAWAATGRGRPGIRAVAATADLWSDLTVGGDGGAVPPARVRTGADGVPEVVLVARALDPGDPLRGLLRAGYADGVAGTPATAPGPTLVLTPGRRTRVILDNQLDEPTSLHLHGLRIAPAVDAPFTSIAPGASHTYDVTVPATQTGTCWYHPHLHGLVDEQMRAGLTGGLTLDPAGFPEPVLGALPQLLVLTALDDARHVLVNGRREPHLSLSGRVRLRLVNTSTARTLSLRLVDQGRPLLLAQVATDGGWLRTEVPRTDVALAAGERAEVLVDLPERQVALVALPRAGSSDGGEVSVLATLTGTAGQPATPLSTAVLRELPRLLPGPHTRVRRIVLGASGDGTVFTIDGRAFDHHRTDLRVRRGSTEVWEVVNTTGLEHPFHLHSYPFQVLERGWRREWLAAWRDVTLIRPYETVRLLIPFHGYGGRTVFHCHNVAHEDAGMMATVLVS